MHKSDNVFRVTIHQISGQALYNGTVHFGVELKPQSRHIFFCACKYVCKLATIANCTILQYRSTITIVEWLLAVPPSRSFTNYARMVRVDFCRTVNNGHKHDNKTIVHNFNLLSPIVRKVNTPKSATINIFFTRFMLLNVYMRCHIYFSSVIWIMNDIKQWEQHFKLVKCVHENSCAMFTCHTDSINDWKVNNEKWAIICKFSLKRSWL